jgi:hypothetical protein
MRTWILGTLRSIMEANAVGSHGEGKSEEEDMVG